MAKSKKKAPAVIAVLICACLLFAMYISLSTLTLGLWGQTVMGTVDSYDSRLDNTDAGQNRSRTISKGYYFMVNGKEYRGYVMYYSDESWPRLSGGETRSERISYFPFFPYINKPFALVDFDHMGEAALIYHTLSPVGCIILLLLVTGAFRRKKATRVKKVVAQQNVDRSDADMFCTNCGSRLPENAAFCSSCGAKILTSASRDCAACGATIPNDALFCINCGAAANTSGTPIEMSQSVHPQTYSAPQQHNSTQRTGLVGFSDLCNSREILVAAQKNKKSSIGCMWILVLVPLIGFPVAGLAMDDFPFGESLVIGIGIALVMLIVNLIALRRTRRPMWEGVVVDKYSKERSEQRGGDDDNYRTYTEYTTVIRTDAGKKKTIVEKDSGRHMYDYLAVGDRVRFHPKFGTYEKFDKSKDRIIYCNICSMMNPIQNDRCKRCSNLLFK